MIQWICNMLIYTDYRGIGLNRIDLTSLEIIFITTTYDIACNVWAGTMMPTGFKYTIKPLIYVAPQ